MEKLIKKRLTEMQKKLEIATDKQQEHTRQARVWEDRQMALQGAIEVLNMVIADKDQEGQELPFTADVSEEEEE